jgi:hypothetical protein
MTVGALLLLLAAFGIFAGLDTRIRALTSM